MKRIISILILTLIFWQSNSLEAQSVVEIPPLFEYPNAPEEMESLEEKCNYLVKNFWNNFDFKTKQPIDQYALNEAFSVYVTPMRYSNTKEVDQSVDKLISKISGNPILLLQFTKAAEENLYGPRADFWSDTLYLKFLDAIIKNKKIKDNRKTKYLKQESALRKSSEGSLAPTFDFTDINGDKKTYFPMSTPTLLIFGDPDNTDWRLARLKMDSNYRLEEAIDKGKLNILYILPQETENWQRIVSNYNPKWTIGASKEVSGIYDIRLDPSIYFIGSDGKIQNKYLIFESDMRNVLDKLN